MTTELHADEAIETLLAASRAFVAIAARSVAAAEEVTLAQFRALVVLSGSQPVTVSSLATELDIHPSTATRMCDRLVRKRLIRRAPRVSGDRREVSLALTPRARRLLDSVTTRRRSELTEVVSRMSEVDRHHAIVGMRAFLALASAGGSVLADAGGWEEAGIGTAADPTQ